MLAHRMGLASRGRLVRRERCTADCDDPRNVRRLSPIRASGPAAGAYLLRLGRRPIWGLSMWILDRQRQIGARFEDRRVDDMSPEIGLQKGCADGSRLKKK